MRPSFARPATTALALGTIATITGCASLADLRARFLHQEPPRTPIEVTAWPSAPEGPFQARVGERVITQFTVSPHVVALVDDADGVEAGTRLFGVENGVGGMRYCVAPDIGAALTCFEDTNEDGLFDLSVGAASHREEFPLAPSRWARAHALDVPAAYRSADRLSGPLRQVAIRYLGRSYDGRYGFALQLGGPEGFADVDAIRSASWLAPDAGGVVEYAGARIEVLETSRTGVLTYRLEHAMPAQPLTVEVSAASRTLGALTVMESLATG